MPGDIVLTGTPANSRPMQPGDLIEVEIDGLGRLSNRVVAAPAPQATARLPADRQRGSAARCAR